MKITAKSRGTGNLTEQGLHLATVSSCIETKASTGGAQLEVSFKALNGSVRKRWFNLVGYKVNRSGNFVDKNNKVISMVGLEGAELEKAAAKRVVDEERTQKAMDILGNFATDLGFDAEEEVSTDDFIGKECLIGVKGNGTDGSIVATFATNSRTYAEKYLSEQFGYEVELSEEV